MLVHRVLFGEAEQRTIRDAMARYLSPAVSRWVLEDPDRLRLGGELREMTVLFSDLRNFTTLAHTLPPETLVALSCATRSDVDDTVNKAMAAGGRPAMDPQDHGFMYASSFYDLDGHHWEVVWMDPAATHQEAR